MKIRTRYTLMTALLIGSVVVAIALTVTRSQRSVLESQSHERLQALSEGVARLAQESLDTHDQLMLIDYLMYLKKDHPELAYAAVTRDGHTSSIGEVGPALYYWSQSLAAKHHAKNAAAESLEVKLGFVMKFFDDEIERQLQPMVQQTAALAAVFMVVGMLGAYSLGGLLTAPIVTLTAAVSQIKGGNLDVSVAAYSKDEVGALAARFNEMTGRIRELLQGREDILHTLTHELNTPLSGLKGYLELWQDRALPAQGQERQEVLGTMMAAVLRMEASLGDALRLFRAEADVASKDKHVVWINDLFRQVCVLFAPIAQSKRISIELPAPTMVECVCADDELLRKVVMNLISNALKYTPDGGRVTLGLDGTPTHVRFWVSDTGYGIKPEDLPHLFTKFYRTGPGTENRQRIPGTGLGLSIADRAAKAMGGRIVVDSALGKGTTFTVVVPRAPMPSGTAATVVDDQITKSYQESL
jgi:signal transduction histidine kinase